MTIFMLGDETLAAGDHLDQRKARIMLVDDHAVVLAGVRSIVETSPNFTVVGAFTDGNEAIRNLTEVHPDLIVLDLRLGSMLGPEICRRARRVDPRVKILMLTGFAEAPLLRACMNEGATGVMLKAADGDDLLDAMRRTLSGETFIAPSVQRELEKSSTNPAVLHGGQLLTELRPSEYRVLRLLARGMTTSEIQKELDLSANTVRSYIQTLMEKLDARTRIQAIVKAQALHLL